MNRFVIALWIWAPVGLIIWLCLFALVLSGCAAMADVSDAQAITRICEGHGGPAYVNQYGPYREVQCKDYTGARL